MWSRLCMNDSWPVAVRWLALLLCLAISHATAVADSPAEKLPNIVVMLVDDMGIMDTSVPFLTDEQGRPKRYPLNDFYRTPNMERLAARGTRFSQFYAMSVCSPTRVSLLTGQNAARHRTTNWIDPFQNNAGPQGPRDWNWQGLTRQSVTLPRLLQARGYRTIHVGKGHLGPQDADGADPRQLGFDVNVAGASIGSPGSYYGRQNFDGKKPSKYAVPGLERYHGQDIFLTEALTREAVSQIDESVKAGRPFYLNFWHYAVHAPFNSDSRFAANYRDSGRSAEAQAFATLVEGMDKSLGDVLDHLDKLGIADTTLVFFLGDNGTNAPLGNEHVVACAAPLRGKKGAHYEGGMRAPFIAAWAKPNENQASQRKLPIARGAIQSHVVSVCDLFPTILNLSGVQPPANHPVDGQKLDTLVTGRGDSAHSTQFLMHYPHAPHRTNYFTTYREGDWKVIYHYFPTAVSGGSHYQLFHLGRDPFEQEDLAMREPAELRRLMQGLIARLKDYDAAYPVDKDRKLPVRPELP